MSGPAAGRRGDVSDSIAAAEPRPRQAQRYYDRIMTLALTHANSHAVTDADTASAVGSGDVPVLATPRLITWLEAAAAAAAVGLLNPGQTTVGTSVRLDHRRPTPVGGTVTVTATLPTAPTGRRLTFTVEAVDANDQVIAAGEIDRVIVNRNEFLTAAGVPLPPN